MPDSTVRFPSQHVIISQLDPIEDTLNLISNLKSREFTSDLLRGIHGFDDSAEISITSELIGQHVDGVLGFAEQGLSGRAEYSYLPLYYSILNLQKINLLMNCKSDLVINNRFHGASYDESQRHNDFFDEELKIKQNGTIPLLIRTISGEQIPRKGVSIRIGDIYSAISATSAEYAVIMKSDAKLFRHFVEYIKNPEVGSYLKVIGEWNTDVYQFSNLKNIHAYKSLQIKKESTSSKLYLATRRIKGDPDKVFEELLEDINPKLVSDYYRGIGGWSSITPAVDFPVSLNEDLCITLAFYHLSNIVRYSPDHLSRIMNSKYWPLVVALRKHGYYTLLQLSWGSFNKYCFAITR